VPWETVREDYLLSNKYRHDEVQKRMGQLCQMAAQKQGVAPDQVDMANMNAFLSQDGSYIDASLDEMEPAYESVQGYLRDGLSFTNEEIVHLRNELLR